MTPEEAIKTIKVAIADIEWNYPLDYSIAFETAIEALEKQVPKKPNETEQMTDRERLICLLSEYDFDLTFCDICERPDDDCAVCGSERLAEYLISNGVIVPPCNVGDIVYVCYEEIPIIHKKQICLIICQHSYGKSQLEFHCTDFYIFYGEEIGKTVFLTREEAEKALNDMKQGDKI